MKTNKESLKDAMDRRLSFLDDRPSCRAALQYRIAQEEEPVMKKKVSFGFVLAVVCVLLSVAALATGLLLSPRVSAARTADQALEKAYGITAEMQTFFFREVEEQEDGTVRVTYTGVDSLQYVLGTYTAVVRDGRAEVSWDHDGQDTSGGYDAEAWGLEQLQQMFADATDEKSKKAYLERAAAIAEAHNAQQEDGDSSEKDEGYFEQREADKTAAMKARTLSEEEMIAIGREFILSNYDLNGEQAGRMELYTNSYKDADNTWYEMIDGKPCFLVEYLLYEEYTAEQMEKNEPRGRTEKDGYYRIFVNVETGTVEEYEYNSALGGIG